MNLTLFTSTLIGVALCSCSAVLAAAAAVQASCSISSGFFLSFTNAVVTIVTVVSSSTVTVAVAALESNDHEDNNDDGNGDRVCAYGDDSDGTLACNAAADGNTSGDDYDDDDDECGLYLAPSSIPGAGLGVYSGHRHLQPNDWLAEPDIGVPIYDPKFHHGGDEPFLWSDYVWQHGVYTELQWESFNPDEELDACTFGIGAAVNFLVPLVNIADSIPTRDLIDRGGLTSTSPGDGAITPYHGRRFMASKHIEPYSELFIYYGESYFLEREGYEGVPLSADYSKADRVIVNYVKAIRKWQNQIPFFRKDEVQGHFWELILDMIEIFQLRVRNALPSGGNTTVQDFMAILSTGGTKMMPYNSTVKSWEWMKKNGQCMDNIRPGISQIPNAGRGAFAARFISAGSLVSPSPLVHIPNRASMQFYGEKQNSDPNEEHNTQNVSSPVHQQLILNYCWGSRDSTLLLCPYGHVTNLINHDPDQHPNTKIVWSNRMRNPEWLHRRIEDWGHEPHNGLSFDYIATRDILPGEEITIDYGTEWVNAWQEHVRAFESSPPRPKYIPGFEWNNKDSLPPIPTVSDPPEQQLNLNGVLLTISDEYLPEGHEVNPFSIDITGERETFYLCRVVERQQNGLYFVEVFERPDGLLYDATMDVVKLTLRDVPQTAFHFQDVPYARSHSQSWSFRHDMRIPDDMLPDMWKNAKYL